MFPIFSKLIVATAIIFTLLYAASPVIEFPPEVPGTITFIGNAGGDNTFTVDKWKFDQVTNLGDPTNIQVKATLDMTSITTGWKDLETNLHKKKDYFHSKKFTTAQVLIDGATLQADSTYLAEATLSLKGVSREVPITFTISGAGPFDLKAEATINRRQFRFTGKGPKDEVPVMVDVSGLEEME